MLPEVFLFLAAVYILVMSVVALAAAGKTRHPNQAFRPTVAIIIPARNEEKNIRNCLDSVLRLTYPVQLLDVVVVDDHSTDATHEIISQYMEKFPHIRLVVAPPESGQLRGKTNAVSEGIDASRGEILLFTDADCTIAAGWVEETVKYYADSSVGIVAGFTSLHARGWFSGMQALDWFFLFTLAAGAVGLHYPITAVGNNLSVRRKAYDAVGGYRTIPFSVTEDFALFRAVTSKGRFGARFPLNSAALIESEACETWQELYRQKKRWFTGARGFSVSQVILFVLVYLLYILIPLSAFSFWSAIVLCGIALKVLADFLMSLPAAFSFHRWKLLLFFPIFEVYLTSYVLVMPLLVLFGKEVIWKERAFEGRA